MATSESLMFDGNRVQEEQEEELKQEEDERQQQLKDLLANAFDDIDADETCSFVSDESHDSGRHSDEIGQQNRWNDGKLDHHASTPVSESRAPPLITPMIQRRYTSSTVPNVGRLPYTYSKQNGDTLYQEPEPTAMTSYDSNLTQQSETDNSVAAVYHHQPQLLYSQPRQQASDSCNGGSYPSSHSSHHSGGGSDITPRQSYTQPAYSNGIHGSPHYRNGGVQEQELTQYQNCHNQYNGEAHHLRSGSSELDNTVFTDGSEPRPINGQKTSTEQLQDRYFKEGAGAKNAQIGILYQAKSRQLQELQEKYELLQLESSKELRILRHEVALLQGSKQGTEGSLKQTQALLTQNKEARFELQKRIDSYEDQNKELIKERDQLSEQLSSDEGSIESLNAQIFALGSTDTVERMREQHESITNTLRQEHEKDVHGLNQQLAGLRLQLHHQSEEVDSTKLLLKSDMEAIAKERLDHAETVNRLTNSLKESQRQIEDLLNQSCGTELSKIRIQLQQSTASKMVTEQLCDSLQNEICDLKEQISLYETSQTVNSLFAPTASPGLETDSYDDTLIELGIKPLRKSASCKSLGPGTKAAHSSDETILILRQELQKCLGIVKEKRMELSTLRSKFDQKTQEDVRMQTEVGLLRDRLTKTQIELKEASIELNLYKSAANDGNSLIEVKLRGQIDCLSRERTLLQEELECLNERLGLVAGNEAKLEEINADLNSKISEMIDDFDRDKKAALDRCEETLETHNQTVREMLRSELQAEFDMKVKRLENQYQSELTRERDSNESLTSQLREVKDLYLQVCSEKGRLEEEKTVQDQSLVELQTMIDEVKCLKEFWANQEEKYQMELTEAQAKASLLEQEKANLQNTVTSLESQLETCKDKSSEQRSENSSSVLAACRELFSNGHSADRSKSNNSSTRSSANNSKIEQVEVRALEDELRKERADLQKTLLQAQTEAVAAQETLGKQLGQVRAQLVDSEAKLEVSMKELTELNKELGQLKVIIGDLRSDNQKLDKLLSAERIQLSLSRDDVVTLRNEISDLKLKQSDEDVSLPERLQELTLDMGECRRKLAKVEAELRAEVVSHTQAKEEIDRLRACLIYEKEDHSTTKADLASSQKDLVNERKSHQLIKTELGRKEAELQAEKTSHNQTKFNLSKTRSELSEEVATRKDLVSKNELVVSKNELVKVQVELDAERQSHLKTKQESDRFEASLTSERTTRSLAKSTLTNLQQELEVERREHQETQKNLSKVEADLEIEQASHNKTKLEFVTIEAELSTERTNQTELRRCLEQVKSNHSEQEIELELMKTNQSKDSESIAQLKAQRTQEKSQLEGLKASHTQVVSDLNKAKTELIRKASELNQLKTGNSRLLAELDLLTEKTSRDRQRLVEQHTESLARSLEEARQRWSEEASKPTPDMVAENKFLKEKLNSLESEVQNYEKLLSQADEHFEQQLNKIRSKMEEERKDQIDQLSVTLREAKKSLEGERASKETLKLESEQENKELVLKITSLTQKVSELEGKCKSYQSCAEDLRRNLQSVSSQTDLLKSTNKRLQSELGKMSAVYESKVEQLAKQLEVKGQEIQDAEHEHGLTVQSLKQRMIALKNEQALQKPKAVERMSHGCQTVSVDVTSKHQYDLTIQHIRDDVLLYVEETNRNAAKLIKCEIHKAKQATARQLRNYYVKCYKQSLHDNRSSYEEKLSKLERTLDNAVAAINTPPNINTDSLLSVPQQFLTESLKYRTHSEICPDHTISQLYSRGPTPVTSDIFDRETPVITANSGRATFAASVADGRSNNVTPVPDTDSRYSYVPLRHATVSSSRSVDRELTTPVNSTNYNTDTSDIIRELGLDNTETSPPRWYNPPPEKLAPSPIRREYAVDEGRAYKYVPPHTKR